MGKGIVSIARKPATAPSNKMNPTIVAAALFGYSFAAVSYTHLTLPTILRV